MRQVSAYLQILIARARASIRDAAGAALSRERVFAVSATGASLSNEGEVKRETGVMPVLPPQR
jgi:hypothetical protein